MLDYIELGDMCSMHVHVCERCDRRVVQHAPQSLPHTDTSPPSSASGSTSGEGHFLFKLAGAGTREHFLRVPSVPVC